MARFKCPLCEDHYTSLEGLYDHIDDEHDDSIPKDFTPARYYYYLKTGRTHGKCVVCGKPTEWNEITNKYHRFCSDPNCKKKYRGQFKKRMIGKYGKVTLLNDPDQQKKMLANRSISGTYKWSDGTEKTYTGTYELDFLKFLDSFMNFDSADVMTPSPHIYYYMYEGEKKFYFPDVFIPSLNLEIEVKDGGDNPNMHHKIQDVDKVKEKLKDDVMNSQKEFNYIKIINKNYDSLLEYLLAQKKKFINDNKINFNKSPNVVTESYDILQKSYDSTMNINNSMFELNYITEGAYKNPIYFISEKDMTNQILQPRVPNNFLTSHGYEDNTTKRVCFSTSIHGALKALSMNLKGKTLYVHSPIDYQEIHRPNVQEVPDVNITNEVWVFNPVKIRTLGTIYIEGAESYPGEKYTYGDNKVAELYGWKWKWLNKVIESVNVLEENSTSNKKMYPIYAVLFSNDTDFGKMIRKVTGSPYSHATVTLDPSLNDMYSFSDIPYNHASFTGAGFVRESLWSPMYRKNSYFTVLVTFTDEEGIQRFKDKLEIFKQNYTKYKYNDAGLLQYYLNMKNTKNHDEKKKMRWFCSEFVSYMLYNGKKESFQDILQSPSDIRSKKDMIVIGDYTLSTFNENDLKQKTRKAYKDYVVQQTFAVKENAVEDIVLESSDSISDEELQSLLEAKIKDGVQKESDITQYTAMLDWKYLYNQFISIFPDTNSELRFDLFEIIIRDYIVPLRIHVDNTTHTIINELTKIKSVVSKNFGKIIGIDIPNKTIRLEKNNRETSIIYPDLTVRR